MRVEAFLWISLAAVSSSHRSEEVHSELKEYEVVRPVRLHTPQKRHTQSSHTDTVSYRLELKQKNIHIHLRRNRELISSSYTETHYTPNGTRVTTVLQDQGDHQCYYLGSVGDDQQSVVSMSTCEGLRGFFRAEGQDYIIEPLTDSETGDHAVFKAEFLKSKNFHCGVSSRTMKSALPAFNTKGCHRSMFDVEDAEGNALLNEQKYIEMYLVVDNSEFRNLGSDIAKVRKRMFQIINFVDMVYLPLHTFIALVGLEVWSDGNRINVSSSAPSTLSAFTQWRTNQPKAINQIDNAQLITAVNFGNIVGLANVDTLCTTDSNAVVRDFSSNALATGAVLAHELGHNLGMEHDDSSCSCGYAHCIMSPELSNPPPEHFSNCSVADYETFLQTSSALKCLLDKPAEGSIIAPPVCGNSFKEEGEECDCGLVEECTDPCCNAATCTLTPGSQCSSGECCNNCKFLPLDTMCRNIRSMCDLPEYCTGASGDCPEDTYRENGLPCRNDSGYCYDGDCPLRLDQCIQMWGDTAEVAPDSCYDLNVKGTDYAYCRRPRPQDYIGCPQKDVMCGKLFCSNGSAVPQFGDGVTHDGVCKSTVNNSSMDDGLVQTGTRCGDGRVCSGGACVELDVAYGQPNCSKTCKGNTVCNNKAECQCTPGWVPPDCTKRYTGHITYNSGAEGLSKDSSIALGVCLAIILTALSVAVLIAAVWRIKKWKSEQSQRPPGAGRQTKHRESTVEVFVLP
ncbi:zinc metalloproteinase/disintegrin-like HR1a [Salminus brasiliensis]|uniref:zinc metalloproteinase/disintegrin-like HR1a n=1 Tax=Salminus brasiliensis TaxID=930266 RepID=UPI003B82FEA6